MAPPLFPLCFGCAHACAWLFADALARRENKRFLVCRALDDGEILADDARRVVDVSDATCDRCGCRVDA